MLPLLSIIWSVSVKWGHVLHLAICHFLLFVFVLKDKRVSVLMDLKNLFQYPLLERLWNKLVHAWLKSVVLLQLR